MKKNKDNVSEFPISKTKIVFGSRRKVREKVLQILVAHFVSNTDINFLYNHIFKREFTTEEDEVTSSRSSEIDSDTLPLLTDEEILNMNSDSLIK